MKKVRPVRVSRRTVRQRRAHRSASFDHQLTSRAITLMPTDLNKTAPMFFTSDTLKLIRNTVGSTRAESGGPLGGELGSGVVEHFHLDTTSARTSVTYYPDTAALNDLFRETWNPRGIRLNGVVHSHPAGATRPSGNDLEYAGRILAGIPELDRFYLPIVQTLPDTGSFSIGGFAAVRDGSRVRLEQVPVRIIPQQRPDRPERPEFERVRDAYDMDVMRGTRVVAVGCGGSVAFLEDMARAGVGEFVLIDPDTIEARNIATQQVYRSDVGSPKVDAIARRLVDISPTVRVWSILAGLNELTDAAIRRLSVGWLEGSVRTSPSATLLCAFTDTFEIQARVHRLGLHLGVPVIGGTVYAEGRGVEVTFAAAGVTAACIRCAQQSRYNAYLEEGFRNNVGSAGAPIMSTSRLNSLKLPIALGLLHTLSHAARPEHPATIRFRRLLESIAHKNLVVASLDPDIHESLGLRMFAGATVDFDGKKLAPGSPLETVLWRVPTPDHTDNGTETCPDCGGTGDLSTSVGRFTSTTPMPLAFGENRR